MLKEPASAEYWDKQWTRQMSDVRALVSSRYNHMIRRYIPRYVSAGAKILDGGCSWGDKVFVLKKMGYDAYGIDFAKKTVDLVNKQMPELSVSYGDVCALPFERQSFDGYISFGVIEHFLDGYERIIQEAGRVLRNNGFLFLAFPYLSLLRRLKLKQNKYPILPQEIDLKSHFYQFLLDERSVARDLAAQGYCLKKAVPFDALKGFKEEITSGKRLLDYIYASRDPFSKGIRQLFNLCNARWSAHTVLLIFQKYA